MDAEQEKRDKAAFAAFLFQTSGDAYAAAQLLYPTNVGIASRIAQFWPFDKLVIAERARIATELQSNDSETLKKYLSQKARAIIENDANVSPKDRLAAMELLAKLHGVITAEPEGDGQKTLPPEPTYKVVRE